jgi:hypothetical protein
MNAKWINKDTQSLENDGNNLRVKIDAAGALERTADGLNIKTGGVSNDQLTGNIAFEKLADNANIARLDQDETVAGNWDFTNLPTSSVSPSSDDEFATKAYVDNTLEGENIVQEMHTVTAAEVTAGYFSLSNTPVNAQSVRMTVVGGPMQNNNQIVGSTGATPDFDVLNDTEIHINNNGSASGLSGDIEADDILIIEFQK